MKDLNNLNKKTKAAAILILVTILLLISNYFIGRNSQKTNETIKAIYNDRLMVSHYIFQYNNAIHQIKAESVPINSHPERQKEVTNHLQSISSLHPKYLSTVLTPEEKQQFKKFQTQCTEIKIHNQNKDWGKIIQLSQQSLNTLKILAQIQIDEGKTELTTANTLHSGNQIFAQFEIGLFIILACLSFYLLILKKMKVKIKIPEGPSLN
ncbi:MCP four helix bundle domain-containing protein [Flavobacterium faecale]|uniref:MCP four helix bundle domain-containing protein n=1 Tax=Flavobacterium faecale TaxID=1355330 RepID=UPI003AAFA921